MKSGKAKKIFSLSCIIISVVMVLFIVLKTPDLPNALKAILTLDKRFFSIAILCYAGYISFEGLGLYLFLKMHHNSMRFLSALHCSFIGYFYANITPGATGGQPMQVVMMSDHNIPVGTATSALTVRYVFNQISLVVSTLFLWVTHRAFIRIQLAGVIPLVVLGVAVNFFPIVPVLLVSYHPDWTNKAADIIIAFLGRHHILRHQEKASMTLHRTLNNFQSSMMTVAHRPAQLIIQFLISMAQTFCLMMVPVMVFYAFYQNSTSWHNVLTVSYALFSSASYTPLPGASGAQEGGFLLYFRGLFEGGTLSVALLVWRFITYYLSLITGALDGIFRALRNKLTGHQRSKDEE